MKRHVLLLAGLLTGICLQAQVLVNFQFPPLGLTIKPQLWNLSLVNTATGSMPVRVEMVLTDIATNQRVLTGTSKVFTLPPGARQLQLSDVMPIVYNPGNAGYPMDPSPEGFLPIGVFNVCYSIVSLAGLEGYDVVGEACETLHIEPLSPPQLVVPLDEEALDITRPFFAWAPPAPLTAFQQLLYDWILVEVMPTQSPADALQQNIPVLTRQNLNYTHLQYPLSSPELDTSKLYAWRITAKNNIATVAHSETWTFRVQRYQQDEFSTTGAGYFARLHPVEDAAFVICSGVLRFEFLNQYNSNLVNLTLTDLSSTARKQLTLAAPAQIIRMGANFVQLDLRDQPGMIDRHMYLLEVTDFKQEKRFLKFEYRKSH
ncbi:MAG: hypothetical protein P0Y53_10620 [Candidatus Pseudobacter hemicellulosilyticus]|uniref:DUF928 domain-containing protein n=1 Tax=Candidatus Pseudobacter hemicellulosilyticus TaxID=3121375 RepID=A0AAJ6BI49_9BACT|nr:MAG: hypothetical protein P0Y53_10620 [Pseudobacter sp.]